MSGAAFAAIWGAALAYTAYAVGVSFAMVSLLGENPWGILSAVLCAIAPVGIIMWIVVVDR